VTLTVRSPGETPREVTLTRRTIPANAFPPVEARRLPGGSVGLITIGTFFSEGVDQQVRQQIERLAQEGPLDGLILDLRDNGGGYIHLMLQTLALFVDGGLIGSSGRGAGAGRPIEIPGGATLPELAQLPVVVLIGPDTASAAEMFAAGMQLGGRARIVGEASSGNVENLVQHSFSDGSRLWLAELAYRLPDGTPIEGRGVLPNRVVQAEWWRYPPESDPQLLAALEELETIGRR
jgi:C-terminal processing protease CtpA/Prc